MYTAAEPIPKIGTEQLNRTRGALKSLLGAMLVIQLVTKLLTSTKYRYSTLTKLL